MVSSVFRLKILNATEPSGLSKTEKIALEGISYLRGIDIFDPISTQEQSIEYLKNNPHVSEKFKRTFPFINFI